MAPENLFPKTIFLRTANLISFLASVRFRTKVISPRTKPLLPWLSDDARCRSSKAVDWLQGAPSWFEVC
jgi:hypothetical protein